MEKYVFLTMILNFCVNFLLLLGTNRLLGYSPGGWRTLAAAALGGGWCGLCLVPGFDFLENVLWRMVLAGAMCMIAFGIEISCLRRMMVFALLSFAVSGAADAMGTGNIGMLLPAAGLMILFCLRGLGKGCVGRTMVPVELHYQNRKWNLTALLDTGNLLRDPITGEQVLVADAQMGQEILGLTHRQLSRPVETMVSGKIPGLRLIPYRTIGQPMGMLLAVRCPEIRIGSRHGSGIVAFAPGALGGQKEYQILAGGLV